jgi:hypothetical protein
MFRMNSMSVSSKEESEFKGEMSTNSPEFPTHASVRLMGIVLAGRAKGVRRIDSASRNSESGITLLFSWRYLRSLASRVGESLAWPKVTLQLRQIQPRNLAVSRNPSWSRLGLSMISPQHSQSAGLPRDCAACFWRPRRSFALTRIQLAQRLRVLLSYRLESVSTSWHWVQLSGSSSPSLDLL